MATGDIQTGGGKLPPKDLDEPVMGNGLDVHVYIESGPPVSVKD